MVAKPLAPSAAEAVEPPAAPRTAPRTDAARARPARPSLRRGAMLQRQVDDPRPLQIISIDAPRHVRVSEWLVESGPGGSARSELYWIDFSVDAKGVMTASVRTVSPDRAHRSGTLRFGNEFRRALDHFRSGGVAVKEFEADWSYMTKEEISENLKVFREGMAQGLTREKAAQATPTGKVLATSGFEVTHVENVPESQPHLAEEGVRRWRVRATFRPAPTAPTGSTAPAGTPKGTTPGRAPTGPSLGASIGWGLAELVIYLVLAKIAGDVIEEQQQAQITHTWNMLLPTVQADLKRRVGDIEKLLRETKAQKTIYANVRMDLIMTQSCYEGGCTDGYYGMTFLPPVGISTDNVNRMDNFSGIDPAPYGNIIHYPVTFSFPVAQPTAPTLRNIYVIHRLLGSTRRDLLAIQRRSAAQALALDHVNVAIEAADYTRPTSFRNATPAERYSATVREVKAAQHYLEGQDNPEDEGLRKGLNGTLFLLQAGMSDEWPLMLEEDGASPWK